VSLLKNYRLDCELSASAGSIVFRAHRLSDGLPVAVKRLREEHPGPRALARLRREYAVLRSLDIPQVARPLGLEPDGHRLALILEYVDGEPVDVVAARDGFGTVDFVRLALEVARAVDAFHVKGVIHKDLEPRHLVRDATGAIRILDFGSSTRLEQERLEGSEPDAIEGTLSYISPEQTGRLSRAVDRRSDLYSLGVVLYQLATGRLPFRSSDPLELVHAHLAKIAPRADAVRPSVPAVVASILEKLMAKAAEDRYQSAAGLAADLERCLGELEGRGAIELFALGTQDFSDVLRLPEVLYGRGEASRLLQTAFAEAQTGVGQLVLVGGPPGIGKSALVRQLRRELVLSGHFVSGKFDQLSRHKPYSALADACRELVHSLLGAPPELVVDKRRALLAALGSSARVIIDLVPELEHVIGAHPPAPNIGPSGSRNRFEEAFDRFLGVFAGPGEPLVLFLDDLQWADPNSLRLLRRVLKGSQHRPVLVLGAFRESDASQPHPLDSELGELGRAAGSVRTVHLKPLSLQSVGHLVADAVSGGLEDTAPLAASVFEKTRGNPFHVTQFLTALARDRLLRPDRAMHRWVWDLAAIDARRVADDIVDLVLERLRTLPLPAQRVLSLGACIGHEFDSATMALVSGLEPAERIQGLEAALQEGVLLPLDENYRYLGSGPTGPAAELNARFRFLHDRVQQAAYELLDEPQRRLVHLKIGRLLRRTLGADPSDEQIFTVTQQLNRAVTLLDDQAERDWLAELNLRCAKKAQASAATASALEHLTQALALVGPDGWTRQYATTSAAHIATAEGEFLGGNHAAALAQLDEVDAHATEVLDRLASGNVRTMVLTAMGRLPDACLNGVSTLRLLGLHLPDPADAAALGEATVCEFAHIQQGLAGRTTASLLDLPELTDPDKLAELDTLSRVLPAAYQSNQAFMALVVLTGARVCFEGGTTDLAPFFYAQYALAHLAITGDHRGAYDFGRLAIDVGMRRKDPSVLGPAHFIFGGFVAHFREHLSTCLEHFELGVKRSLELGDVQHAAYSAAVGAQYRIFAGLPLEETRAALTPAFERVERFGDVINHAFLVLCARTIAGLTGECDEFGSLEGDGFDEVAFQATLPPIVFETYQPFRAMVRYLAGRYAGAISDCGTTPRVGLYAGGEVLFFEGLSRAALARVTEGEVREAHRSRLGELLERTRALSELCPANHAHKHALLEAERASLDGELALAMKRFEDAIEGAGAQGFLHHEALANELCGKFHLAAGRAGVARAYLVAAVRGYERWGARAKVEQLVEAHPGLELREGAQEQAEPPAPPAAGVSPPPPPVGQTRALAFDLESAIRATQAIASELESGKLIDRLLRILVENAGAQRGVLVLPRDGELFVEAVHTVEPNQVRVGLGQALEGSRDVPVRVVRYVARSHETVGSGEALAELALEDDHYLLERAPKSFLCVALMLKGRLSAVVYLENRDAVGVFAPSRVSRIQFLATQAAAALENSRLYEEVTAARRELERTNETLERRVLERTEELRLAKDAAEAGTRAKSSFLANMSHEIRTPMNGVLGSAELLLSAGLNEDQRSLAETLHDSAEALLTILDDILDFSKAEAGQVVLERAPFDPEDVVFGVVELFRARMTGGQVDLLARVDPSLSRRLVGDAGRIRQVLANLVGNAIKFTSTGRVRIDAAAGATTPQGVELEVRVSDTGIGITAEQRSRLFQPFGQGDASTARRFGGTGLGLAISRAYVSAMGGTLTVESRTGEGSAFACVVPVGLASPIDEVSSRLRRGRVLLVDGGEERRGILAEQLAHLGFEVEQAAGGAVLDAAGAEVVLCEQSQLPLVRGGARRIALCPASSVGGKVNGIASLQLPVRSTVLAQTLDGAGPRPEAQRERRPLVSARVLLADDNRVNLTIARRMLEMMGATVVVAVNGREAVERLGQEPFDVIFMDCQMPEMDGYEATRLIRENERAFGGHVPIIALTASVLTEERARSLAAGMDDHVGKPVSAQRLRDAVERWGQPAPQAA
jgi:predicted ATPase/signal transduction histidine kinase/CheY-like chemotaxis protein